MLGVASLVAVDLIVLVTYTLVEGVQGNVLQVPHREQPRIVEGVR